MADAKPQANVHITGFNPNAETRVHGDVGISQSHPGYSNAIQEKPASAVNHGSRTATTGTRVALATDTPCREVVVTGKPANTGYVYIGGPTVSSTSYGKRLSADESIIIAIENLNRVWMDVSVSAEGVDYLYVT